MKNLLLVFIIFSTFSCTKENIPTEPELVNMIGSCDNMARKTTSNCGFPIPNIPSSIIPHPKNPNWSTETYFDQAIIHTVNLLVFK